MGKIYFATTNEGKLKEAKEILKMEVVGIPLEIDEVQSLDPIEVATKKARAYYKKLKKPLVVEDVSLIFKALNDLPGTYIDSFLKSLGKEGLIDLIRNKKDKRAIAQTTLVYIDSRGKEHVFIGRVKGKVAKKPKGENGFGWDRIFTPDGSRKTFGEMDLEEKNKYSMRKKAFMKLKKFLENSSKADTL